MPGDEAVVTGRAFRLLYVAIELHPVKGRSGWLRRESTQLLIERKSYARRAVDLGPIRRSPTGDHRKENPMRGEQWT
jgi:hypothetical protein